MGKQPVRKTSQVFKSKSSGSTGKSHRLLFNGGDALEFGRLVNVINQSFVAGNCDELIQLPDAGNPVVEVSFDDAEPVQQHFVANSMAADLAAENGHWDAMDLVVTNSNLDQGDRVRETVKNQLERAKAVHRIQSNLVIYEKRFEEAHLAWTKKKEKFARKQASCMTVFHEVFGPLILTEIKQYLTDKHFKAAWKYLVDKYGSNAGGPSNATTVIAFLSQCQFEDHIGFTNHWEFLKSLFAQLDTFGHALDNVFKLSFLLQSFQKGNVHQYLEQISHIRLNELPLDDAVKKLFARENELQLTTSLDNYTNNSSNGSGSSAGGNETAMAVQHDVAASPKKAKSGANGGKMKSTMKCAKCHRLGHTEKYCKADKECNYCHKMGHFALECRKRISDEKDKSKNASTSVAKSFVPKFNKSDEYCDFVFITSSNDIVEPIPIEFQSDSVDHLVLQTFVSNLRKTRHVTDLDVISYHIQSNDLLVSLGHESLTVSHAVPRIIIDSGATAHMFPYRTMFNELFDMSGTVTLGDKKMVLPIVGIGTTNMEILSNVLYVPRLSVGLISIPVLTQQGFNTAFRGTDKRFIVTDPKGKVVLTGMLDGKLFYLGDAEISVLTNGNLSGVSSSVSEQALSFDSDVSNSIQPLLSTQAEMTTDSGNNNDTLSDVVEANNAMKVMSISTNDGNADHKALTVLDTGLNPLEQLHKEWGHLSEGYIKKALKNNMVENCRFTYADVSKFQLGDCFYCLQGRMKAKASGNTTQHQREVFEKIGIDYKGDFAVRSFHQFKGFMLLSDYHSHYVYAAPVKDKSDSISVLDDFNSQVVVPNGHKWRVLQCDYDSIFNSKKVKTWLNKHEIRLQASEPYVHSQNGQIERDVQSVMDKARTLMAVYKVPPKYWEFAVKTACYLINRSPTAHNNMVTPYEAVTGKKPDIGHLVPFYAPGVYHRTKDERRSAGGAWANKAEPCRMLGYDETCNNAYIVLVIRTGNVITRGNCVFDLTINELLDAGVDPSEADIFELDQDDLDSNTESSDADSTTTAKSKARGDKDWIEDESEVQLSDNDEFEFPYWRNEDAYLVSNLERWYNDTCCIVHEAVALPPNPKDINEALSGNDAELWRNAIANEMHQFKLRDTFGPAPQHGRAMKTKLILKYAYKNDYTIKAKARLVVCGYSQIPGVDYNETYAPTTTNSVVFILLFICTLYQLKMATFDISAAFLEGKNDILQYAWIQPELCADDVRTRVAIKGNWYGEKQAPKIWNDQFDKILTAMGFDRCPVMPCLYYKKFANLRDFLMLTVHVDDGLMVTSNERLFKEFITELQKHVIKAELFETFSRYLGMDFNFQTDGSILVTQCTYIEEKFSDYTKPTKTPMSNTTNLRIAEPNIENESLLPITGKLRYLADRSRPDILVATGEMSTGGAEAPSDEHLLVAKRAQNYVFCTKGLGLLFSVEKELDLFAYSDASYVTDGNCKSRLGGCIFLGKNSGAVCSFSRNDTTISTLSHSSTEAEIKAIDETIREVMYVRDLLSFLDHDMTEPTKIFVDNKSAVYLCETLKTSHKTKHINLRINYIRECINDRIIALYFVPSAYNVADLLTKPLPIELYEQHRSILLEGHKNHSPEDWESVAVAMADWNPNDVTTDVVMTGSNPDTEL